MAGGTILVVASGGPPDPSVAGHLPRSAEVIAADGGLEHAVDLGLAVDLVVGDMDSVSPAALDRAVAAGVGVQRHPVAKEATDLELALDVALSRHPARVVVVSGGEPDRLDHLLAVALQLGDDRFSRVAAEAWLGPAHLTVVRPAGAELRGEPGDLVTLLPLHGPAQGVTTSGLLYPLDDEDLPAGTTRGVSNEMLVAVARVRLRGGVLLAVRPGGRGAHHRPPGG